MKRNKLLRSKEYWTVQIQNELYGIMENYMTKANLNRTQLADELKVTKGYITQVLKGDFDHKVSKLVDLSISCNTVPILHFVDLDEFIKNDEQDKVYELMPVPRHRFVFYNDNSYELSIKKEEKSVNNEVDDNEV